MTGTWHALTHQPPFNASTMLLLTDGTVMCQENGGVSWWRLTPSAVGGYLDGTWSRLAPMIHTRLYYGSAVLADGRVIVSGGEYSDAGSETNACEIYDPVLDRWTDIGAPAGWSNIGDGSSVLLPDGRYLTGNAYDNRTAVYDPVAGVWQAGPAMLSRSNEESWVLLPDETVLAPQCFGHPNAEKLVLAANAWVSAGSIPDDLVEDASKEIGPGVLLPDGRAWFVGATGNTALYTPPTIASQPGSWAAGPRLPVDASGMQLGAKDAPGCLLPNGHVLVAVGPVDGAANSFLSPTSFFEFDGAALVRVPDPPNATGVPFAGRMLLLPTGEVAFAAGTGEIHLYRAAGGPDGAWRPTITACPTTLRPGRSYSMHGRQLNGLSQAVGYGDDAMAATNYPLVRVNHLSSGRVYYCRTYDHDTMAVATGTAVHSTNFHLPWWAPRGSSQLTVIANGIPSPRINVTVRACRWPWPLDDRLVARFIDGLAEASPWVLGPNGPIPVGPEGHPLEEPARAAVDDLTRAVRTLRELGDSAEHARAEHAAQREPAIDEEYAEYVARRQQ